MHPAIKFIVAVCCFWAITAKTQAQVVDTAAIITEVVEARDSVAPTIANPAFQETDSAKLKDPHARIPRVAAIRSAILPGWGQVYNNPKQAIWKVPIIYGALGLTGGLLVNNITWYKRTQSADRIALNIQNGKDSAQASSGTYMKVDEGLRRVFFEGSGGVRPEDLRTNRDYFRKNRDYAAIYFVIAWALNVVEATTSAHLSSFDVSPDLTFKVQPGYSDLAGTAGVSFILRVK